jgi:hypothetical protein
MNPIDGPFGYEIMAEQSTIFYESELNAWSRSKIVKDDQPENILKYYKTIYEETGESILIAKNNLKMYLGFHYEWERKNGTD